MSPNNRAIEIALKDMIDSMALTRFDLNIKQTSSSASTKHTQ